MNTHQLGMFNLHLFNALVTMGTREICGLCSKVSFLSPPEKPDLGWWGPRDAARPARGGRRRMSSPLPIQECQQNTKILLFFIKALWMREGGAQPLTSSLTIAECSSTKAKHF